VRSLFILVQKGAASVAETALASASFKDARR
jgi:hypothetical protein